MSALAAATVAALLIASPSHNDADRLAAEGGFLLGSAQRCGVADDRLVKAGRLIRGLIAAASTDSPAEDAATKRFATFFLVSAFADARGEKPVASCPIVARELTRLEQHPIQNAGAGG